MAKSLDSARTRWILRFWGPYVKLRLNSGVIMPGRNRFGHECDPTASPDSKLTGHAPNPERLWESEDPPRWSGHTSPAELSVSASTVFVSGWRRRQDERSWSVAGRRGASASRLLSRPSRSGTVVGLLWVWAPRWVHHWSYRTIWTVGPPPGFPWLSSCIASGASTHVSRTCDHHCQKCLKVQ